MRVLQTLDFQKNCTGVFYEGKIVLNPDPSIYKHYNINWKHSEKLSLDPERTYIYVLLSNKHELTDFSNDPLSFLKLQKEIGFHKKAAVTAKVELDNTCIFSVIPEHKLNKYFTLRQQALESALDCLSKQSEYSILHKAHELTSTISKQNILYNKEKKKIYYNIFGSATGRLTTQKGSLPILNLKKEQRYLLTPQNDAFVELDLNAAEVRMLMALSGKKQPEGDIHEHLQKEIFGGWGKRSEFKERLFAWLYNPSSEDNVFDEYFSRETFRDFFRVEEQLLITPFGRHLSVEERKAQNYLLQSTTSDQVIENAHRIQQMLHGKKTKIAFTLHDSIVLDMSQEDAIMLRDIKEKFEYTRWGNFKSTCKIGRNFGELKEIKI